MKRIVLFLLTNLAVMLVLSIAASVLGVNRYLTANSLDFGTLLAFAGIMGFVLQVGLSLNIDLRRRARNAQRFGSAHDSRLDRHLAYNTVERQPLAENIAKIERQTARQ